MSRVLGSPLLLPPSLPQQPKKKELKTRAFGDALATRNAIFEDALTAAQEMEPTENPRHLLKLADVQYAGPDHFRLKDEKQALLTGQTLDRKLRGTWQLIDKATGQVVDQSKQTIAHIPWMTPRGTFVHNGTDMTLINQQRLRPGVFTRIKDNGEIEAHANILPGKGPSHRYFLDPEKGVYYLSVEQAKIPLMPLLRAMGAKDKQLIDAWGPKLFQTNMQVDSPAALHKMVNKLVRKIEPGADDSVKRQALCEVFEHMELDPHVSHRTLGQPYKNMSLDAILDTTKKLLAVSRGEAEVDDRDHLANQTVHGPEDLISERLRRDYGGVRRKLLMQSSFNGNLQRMPVNALNRQVEAALLHSGLGQALEEVNPGDILDKQARISRLGEGGIPSLDAVPDEARSVQPSHFGFIDPIRTPESFRVGIDVQIARGVRKGNDGKIYSQFLNPKTGKTVFRTPEDVADLAVAFPGEMESPGKRVRVIQGGKMRYVPKDQVDFILPSMEHGMSSLSNLIPMKMMSKGQRVAMGSRMLTQALPVSDPEAPWVQAGVPESPGRSFEEEYGHHMGALHYGGRGPGRVLDVDPDGITVRHADGTKETFDLYNNFPFNRKSVTGDTRIIIRRTVGRNSGCWEGPIAEYVFQEQDEVLSVDPVSGVSAWKQILGLTSHRNDKRLFRVCTESGRFVTVTEDHSLVTLGDDGELRPVYPDQCVVNLTRLPIVRVPGSDQETKDVRGDLDLGRLAGLYLSEGHCPEQAGMVCIAVAPEDRAEEVLALLRRLGHSPYRDGGNVQFTDHARATWLVDNFGHSSHAKRVPAWVLSSPRTFRVGLIEGYMGGDGCLWADVGNAIQVAAVSVSLALRDGMVDVLSSCGIFTTLWDVPRQHLDDAWRDGFGFRVISRHLGRLRRWFFYADRENTFRELLCPKYRSSTFEAVPVPRKARKLLYVGFAEVPHFVYKSACMGAVAKDRVKECHSVFGKWGRSDLLWDKITAITPMPSAAEDNTVYDLCVKDSEMFAVCHGLLVHNTYVHQTPLVQPGDPLVPGQLLAHSNYTDKKGTTALGKNAYVAYLPFRGLNTKDAIVISESYAKRMSSEHMYQHAMEYGEDHKPGKQPFLALFPSKFNRQQVATLDDQGVVRPGTTLNHGDPIVVAAQQRAEGYNRVHKKGSRGWADASLTWDHEGPGQVTDVVMGKHGPTVLVKAVFPMQTGDKLSGRYGDKGVISEIIPDEQMPHDTRGRKFEVLLSPTGITTRTNPAQVLEAVLGKVAEQRGEPYKIPDFAHPGQMVHYMLNELKQAGVPFRESVIDPDTGRKISGEDGRGILVGNRHFMKLHHTAEGKGQSRGTGGYTQTGEPAKGGVEGSKRLALMDTNALLSHGATQVLRDASLIRGQRNEDYWMQFVQGHTPPDPKVPMVYQKFMNELKAAGINVVPDGHKTHIMALTNKDIDELSGNREVQAGHTVHWDKGLKPVQGGLFDESLTGGHGGTRWSHIKLHEPLPNPVMEEPIRRVLGLTGKQFREVLAGSEHLGNYGTGPDAIKRGLESINVKRAIDVARAEIKGGRATVRDAAIRKLGYLKSADAMGIHPSEWLLDKVPVLPPAFRPVSLMSNNMPLVADSNYLYKELIEARNNLAEMKKHVSDVGPERLALYDSFKAVTGLGDPVHPKLQEKQIGGILKHIFGCYDDTTEVLTHLGWCLFENLLPGVEVMTLNPRTGAAEWQVPSAIQHYRYQGEMFRFVYGKRVDLLLTPNHRNWIRRRRKNNGAGNMADGWAIEPAYITASSGTGRYWLRTGADAWKGHRDRPDWLPSSVPLGDFAELVGWWLAEGHLGTDHPNRVCLCQSVAAKANCRQIATLLRRCKLSATFRDQPHDKGEPVRRWTFNSPTFATWLREHCGEKDQKQLSRWLLDWDRDLLGRLLLGYLGGDGSAVAAAKGRGTHKNNTRKIAFGNFTTTAFALADGLMELAMKLGYTSRDLRRPKTVPGHRPQRRMGLSGSRFAVSDNSQVGVEQYDGHVHCCTVPNGIVYVRRNGKPVFSGNSSPKYGTVQRRLLSSAVDLVGRAAITPNPDLDMDHVGIPEPRAWDLYKMFIARRLKRRGLPLTEAIRHVREQSPLAREELLKELEERPVYIDRAPVLHRFGIMAFYPKLTKGHTLQVSPIITKGFNADFDGDAMNYHVPVGKEAVREAIERMLPSKNLISPADFKSPVHFMEEEYVGGLFNATRPPKAGKRPEYFRNKQDAMNAYRRGEISVDTPVVIG